MEDLTAASSPLPLVLQRHLKSSVPAVFILVLLEVVCPSHFFTAQQDTVFNTTPDPPVFVKSGFFSALLFFFPPLLLYMERWHSGKILASLFITHLMDRIKYIFNLFLFFPKELWKVKCRNICLIWHKFINKLINKIDCLQLTEMFRDSSVKCVCASYTHRIYMIWLRDKIGDKKK